LALVWACALDYTEAIIKHRVVERVVGLCQFVGAFGRFVPRKNTLFAPVASRNIYSPPLHEMARKPNSILLTLKRTFGKPGIDQAEKPVKRSLITTMRGCCQEYQISVFIARKSLE
jgi:hypothetical protein